MTTNTQVQGPFADIAYHAVFAGGFGGSAVPCSFSRSI